VGSDCRILHLAGIPVMPAIEKRFDFRAHLCRSDRWSEPRHHPPLAIDQELGEIPANPAGQPKIPSHPGCSRFSKRKSGCASGPFTSIFSNMGKLTP
jgi:hypothetical protein